MCTHTCTCYIYTHTSLGHSEKGSLESSLNVELLTPAPVFLSSFPCASFLCPSSLPFFHQWPDEAFRKTNVFKRHAQGRHGAQRPCLIPGMRKGENTSKGYTHVSQLCGCICHNIAIRKIPCLQVWQFTSVQSKHE